MERLGFFPVEGSFHSGTHCIRMQDAGLCRTIGSEASPRLSMESMEMQASNSPAATSARTSVISLVEVLELGHNGHSQTGIGRSLLARPLLLRKAVQGARLEEPM